MFRGTAVCLLGLVLLYRPISSGLLYALAPSCVYGLLLLTAALCWLAAELPQGGLRIRFGRPGVLFCGFMAAGLISSLRAENWFAGLQWWLAFATYGLTAFLVLNTADGPRVRSFFVSCLLATAVALAAFGLWHYVLYMPALRRWLETEPALFEAAVGAAGPLFEDLEARVASNRAYGNFITPNQLADFLALTFFPLAGLAAGWWRARSETGRRAGLDVAALVFWAAALLLMAAVVYLTGSKGGAVAFCFGFAVFALLAAGKFVRRHAAKLLATAAVLAVLILAAHHAGIAPGPARFARSLGVRVHYWQTTARIALQRPLLGVGPGSWPDWYSLLKEPEFEETQAAHSLYLQLWAETGTVGLLLFVACWFALFGLAAKRPGADRMAGPAAARPALRGAADRRRALTAAGLCTAAVALVFDYVMVGTFLPPRHVPAWLGAAPWLPYLVIYLIWTATFVSVFIRMDRVDLSLLTCGAAAGLAAFLVHSAAEFTMRVPAIGGTVAAVAALLLASRNAPHRRELHLRPIPAVVILTFCAGAVAFWSSVVTRRALEHSVGGQAADSLRSRLQAESAASAQARRVPELAGRARQITRRYRRACAAVPWDDAAWRDLALWLTWLAESGLADAPLPEAAGALNRAVELNPLSGASWALLGKASMLTGDPAGAVEAYGRAAERHPSLPAAWYRYAAAAESRGGMRAEAAEAYRRALALLPRQYHQRNRIPGSPGELAEFWSGTAGGSPSRPLLDIAVELGSRAAGLEVAAGATEVQKVAALTGGLRGGAHLAANWDFYDDQTKEREFWNVLAGRLWEWALREKVKLCEGTERNPPGHQENGASGGT